jgi:starch synthase (maltosyl-transferring)
MGAVQPLENVGREKVGLISLPSKNKGRGPHFSGLPVEGRSRVSIENVSPCVDGGRYPIKRTVGEPVVVEADVFADSHVSVSAVLKYRPATSEEWRETPMVFLGNDRWRAEFTVTEIGEWFYAVEGWVDPFKSWRADFRKKVAAKQNVDLDALAGAKLISEAAGRAGPVEAQRLGQWAAELSSRIVGGRSSAEAAMDETMDELVGRFSDRAFATSLGEELRVTVDVERARFGAWYEMFPRSAASEPGAHGTFSDCEAQLERVAKMGFDVLYFPPIHPIGKAYRKGANNNSVCNAGEPGSPWAIGGAEGGHKAVHPQLGTVEDFRRLVEKARSLGIDVAMDIAFQCSPDHPYLREHPEWFRKRADGSIAYAENPPKKYQDIYPFDFECEDWRALWEELKSIFDFWIEQGVRIFRVDNPHTKSFAFWEWCIGALKREHPKLIFLAEAFTRPAVLNRLAKIGFTQSYNYFPWRNAKGELTAYFSELYRPPLSEFLRPNLWPNTPDILTEYLQTGGRAAFEARLILAATLGASYGIYGPAFELCEGRAVKAGSEEYLDSEKYQIRRWNFDSPNNLSELIARVNFIRRENAALQSNHRLRFHQIENDNIIAYTKSTPDGADVVLTVVNLDPYHAQTGWIELDAEEFVPGAGRSYQMHDLLTGARFIWHGHRNFIELDPNYSPAHIFRLRRRVRTERDFDYFL